MAGYWPIFFCVYGPRFIDVQKKKRIRPISSHHEVTSLVNKQDTAGSPEQAR